MEELELVVREHLVRLPTRRELAFTPLRIIVGSALLSAGLVILWFKRSGGIAPEGSALKASPCVRRACNGGSPRGALIRLPRIFLAVRPCPRVLFQGSGRMVFIIPTEIARIRAFLKSPATLRGYITLGP